MGGARPKRQQRTVAPSPRRSGVRADPEEIRPKRTQPQRPLSTTTTTTTAAPRTGGRIGESFVTAARGKPDEEEEKASSRLSNHRQMSFATNAAILSRKLRHDWMEAIFLFLGARKKLGWIDDTAM
jgi:hypothetical protein